MRLPAKSERLTSLQAVAQPVQRRGRDAPKGGASGYGRLVCIARLLRIDRLDDTILSYSPRSADLRAGEEMATTKVNQHRGAPKTRARGLSAFGDVSGFLEVTAESGFITSGLYGTLLKDVEERPGLQAKSVSFLGKYVLLHTSSIGDKPDRQPRAMSRNLRDGRHAMVIMGTSKDAELMAVAEKFGEIVGAPNDMLRPAVAKQISKLAGGLFFEVLPIKSLDLGLKARSATASAPTESTEAAFKHYLRTQARFEAFLDRFHASTRDPADRTLAFAVTDKFVTAPVVKKDAVPDLAALRKSNLERVMQVRADIAQTTKTIAPEKIRAMLGSRAASPRALLQRKRKAGELLAFPSGKELAYPAVQFGDDGAVRPEVRRLLADGAKLGWPSYGEWPMMLWLFSGNGFLGGATPADQLATDAGAVVDAFTSQFDEELGAPEGGRA